MTDPKTVVFFPEGAFGPTNNCVGIGTVLKERGHRVVFVVEESFAGTLEAKGFEEATMRLAPPPEEPEVPGQFWKDFIRETAPEFRKPTIVQLETFLQPTWQALIDGSMYANDRLSEIFDELAPDAIVEDNVVAFAAIPASGRPWARIVSCNPCEVKDELIPPVFSGYPTDDTSDWSEFWSEYDRVLGPQIAAFDGVAPRARRAAAPGRARLHVRVAVPQPVPVPGGDGLPRARPSSHRPGIGWTRACGPMRRSTWTPRSPAPHRSSTCRSARSDRPTSS